LYVIYRALPGGSDRIVLYYCLMATWTGLGDNTELFLAVLSHRSTRYQLLSLSPNPTLFSFSLCSPLPHTHTSPVAETFGQAREGWPLSWQGMRAPIGASYMWGLRGGKQETLIRRGRMRARLEGFFCTLEPQEKGEDLDERFGGVALRLEKCYWKFRDCEYPILHMWD
jgi:hypothetical protein